MLVGDALPNLGHCRVRSLRHHDVGHVAVLGEAVEDFGCSVEVGVEEITVLVGLGFHQVDAESDVDVYERSGSSHHADSFKHHMFFCRDKSD